MDKLELLKFTTSKKNLIKVVNWFFQNFNRGDCLRLKKLLTSCIKLYELTEINKNETVNLNKGNIVD